MPSSPAKSPNPRPHLARETGVAFHRAGTTPPSVMAPGRRGAYGAQLGLEHQFIDIDNPA